MSIDWSPSERAELEPAFERFPVESGRCAALARVVHGVAQGRDPEAHGLHVRPRGAARFVVPKHAPAPLWASHTLVCAFSHGIDALTGVKGTPFDAYLAQHWEYPDCLIVTRVDVATIDPGIQDAS